MKRNFISLFLLAFILLLFSCKKIYEINVPEELFGKAQEAGLFNEKETLKKYPEGMAYEVFKDRKIAVQVVNGKVKLPVYKKAVPIAYVHIIETNSIPQEGFLGAELSREYLFPCIPFAENYEPKTYIKEDQKKIQEELFAELDAYPSLTEKARALSKLRVPLFVYEGIPENYIALPLQKDTQIIYADNSDYDLFNLTYAQMVFTPMEEPDKKDLYAYDYIKNTYAKEFFNAIEVKTPAKKVTFTAAVGDMMLARGVQDLMEKEKTAGAVFTDTMPILQNNDFTIGNLECVVTNRNLRTPKTYNFKIKSSALPYLKEAGFDYLMLTNNHSYDYGEDGFKDTLAAVKAEGFATSGAGLNDTEAKQFYHTTLNGQKYSVLSIGAFPVEYSGFNGKKQASATEKRAGILWMDDSIIDMVRKEKEDGYIVIINCHAGTEYVKRPNATQTSFYKKLCDAGADVIFGSHPHILQHIEMYNGSLIVWSLGNYIFPGMDLMPGATDTMIVRTGFYGDKLLYYEKYPAKIKNKTVVLK